MYKKYLFLLLLTIFVGCYSFSSYENVTQEGVNSAIKDLVKTHQFGGSSISFN
jgi:hypothetical protein